MKNLLPICAGLAVVSGIVSVTLWKELRAERQLNSDLRTALSESNANSARLSVALSQRPNAATVAQVVTLATPESKPDSPAPAKPAQPSNSANARANSATPEWVLLKDPEYRKARLAQTRLNVARSYPGLAEELGLTEKEADQLFDLMADNQVNMSSLIAENQGSANNRSGSTASNDPAARQEMARRQQALQREQEDAVRSLLGSSKYSQMQAYQEAGGARSQVSIMGNMMAQVGQPLTAAQSRALTTVMIAEQQRQRQDLQNMARNLGNPADPDYRTRTQEESMRRQDESNRRILEAAAATLNSRQMAALREQYEQEDAMRRASARLQRERDRVAPRPVPTVPTVPTVSTVPF